MDDLNRSLFEFLFRFSHRNPLLDAFGVFLAEHLPYLMVLGAVLSIFAEKGSRRRVLFFCEISLAVILSRGIVTEAVRFFYHNPRPFTALGIEALISEAGYSFPSGHAAAYFALAVAVWFANRKWGWWYLGAAFINGIARVFVGVHWPFDVLGGMVVGVLSAAFIHHLLASYRRALGREIASNAVIA